MRRRRRGASAARGARRGGGGGAAGGRVVAKEATAQEVERGLRGAPAYELAVAGEKQFAVLRVRVVGERDVDEADGFVFRAAARPGDACDAEAEVRARALAHALGHR